MNTFVFFLLVQACGSLRFNDAADSENEIDEGDAGRRRRRRRRRRRGGGVPSQARKSYPATGTSYRFETDETWSWKPTGGVQDTSGNGAGSAATFEAGWLLVTSGVEDNDAWVQTQGQQYRFQSLKSHTFDTTIAVGTITQAFFVGLSDPWVIFTNVCLQCIGISNMANAGTDVNFYFAETAARSTTTAYKTSIGGTLALAVATRAAATDTVIADPINALRFGWSYIPGGQFGTAAAATATTGVYKMYSGGKFQADVAATTVNNPNGAMGVTVMQQNTATAAVKLWVKYINFQAS